VHTEDVSYRPTGSAWLTYAQAGERLGMSAEAIRSRARRAGWRTMPGNDGKALVLIPDDATIEPRLAGRPGERPAEQTEDLVRLTKALAAAGLVPRHSDYDSLAVSG
jgi:hypothetical protein